MVKLRMDHEKFWRLTWYEWTLYLKGYIESVRARQNERIDLYCVIANCTAPKKKGQFWTRKDFEDAHAKTNVQERKLTMKEAKQLLGSQWKFPPHAK